MSSLRNILRGVPQDAQFHPEGDVWTHVRLVRRALDAAIAMTRDIFPDIGSRADLRLLRAATWTHDLGKARATRRINGRYAAPVHEKPRYFNTIWRKLGPAWHRLWKAAAFEDRKSLVYLVTRHMGICDQCGLEPRIFRGLISPLPLLRRRARLVVAFMAMDRLGCASVTRVDDARVVIEAAGNPPRPGAPTCRKGHCWSSDG